MFDQLPFGGGASIGFVPVNLATAANPSAYANMRDVNKFLNILIVTGVGTAGEDIVITLKQATSKAGAGAKELLIKRAAYKVGVGATLPALDKWTVNTACSNESPIASLNTADHDQAENVGMELIRVRPQDLDMENGFSFVMVNVAKVTNAQIGVALFIPEGVAYEGADVNGIVLP